MMTRTEKVLRVKLAKALRENRNLKQRLREAEDDYDYGYTIPPYNKEICRRELEKSIDYINQYGTEPTYVPESCEVFDPLKDFCEKVSRYFRACPDFNYNFYYKSLKDIPEADEILQDNNILDVSSMHVICERSEDFNNKYLNPSDSAEDIIKQYVHYVYHPTIEDELQR